MKNILKVLKNIYLYLSIITVLPCIICFASIIKTTDFDHKTEHLKG